jgi:hypothetical protein
MLAFPRAHGEKEDEAHRHHQNAGLDVSIFSSAVVIP